MLKNGEGVIHTFGFEGQHRSGKGTQIELLAEELRGRGVVVLVIKGDGRKPKDENYPVQLDQDYWNTMDAQLSSGKATKLEWGQAAYRLARELTLVRDRILPKLMQEQGAKVGVVLIDRTALSRGVVVDGEKGKLYTEEMRPKNKAGILKGREVTVEAIFPELVFNIHVDQQTLLNRIAPDDPKRDAREKDIRENEGKYTKDYIAGFLPDQLQKRVIDIDGNNDVDTIHNEILKYLPEDLLN